MNLLLPAGLLFVLLAGGAAIGGVVLGLGSNLILAAWLVVLAGGGLLVWVGRPKLLLIGLLFFLAPIDISKALVAPLGQFYSPGLYLTVGHLVLLMLTVLWLGQRLIVERRLPPFGRLDGWALVFLAFIWVGALRSAQGTLAIASAVSYTLAVLGFYVASHAMNERSEWRIALLASLAVVLVQLVYVLLQFAAKDPLPLPGAKAQFLGGSVLSSGAFRPSGFFEHPNALADHMTLILPPALALALLGWRYLPRWVCWAALLVLLCGGIQLLLTLSRGGWVSTFVGLTLVVVVYWRRGLLSTGRVFAGAGAVVVAVGIGIAAYPAVLDRITGPDDRATESRLILNNQAIAIIRTAPLTGVGFGGYNRAAYETIAPAFALISPEYQQSLLQVVVHNHYLLLAAELGIPAAVYFLVLLAAFARLPWSVRQWDDPALHALAIGLSGSVLAQMVFLNSDNYYADIRIFLLWLILGSLRAVCRLARTPPAQPPS